MNTTQDEDLFAGVELQSVLNTGTSVKNVVKSDIPSMLSSEWHDYAMKLSLSVACGHRPATLGA